MKRQPRPGARVRRGGGRLRAGVWLAALALATLALLLPASGDALAQQHPQVGGLRLSSEEPGVLTVEWQAADPEPVDYRVNWARPDQDYPTWTDDRGNAFPTTNSLTLNGLEAGAEYKVQVRARYGAGGSGPWSEEARLSVAAAAEPGADSGGTGGAPGAGGDAGGGRDTAQLAGAVGLGHGLSDRAMAAIVAGGRGDAGGAERFGGDAVPGRRGAAAGRALSLPGAGLAGRGARSGLGRGERVLVPAAGAAAGARRARGAAGQLDGGLAAAERLPGQLGACGRALSVLDGGGGQRLSAGHRVRLTELEAGVEYKVRVRARYRATGNVRSGEWSEARASSRRRVNSRS